MSMSCANDVWRRGWIRTHGTLARTTVFETAPFNHSGTPPQVGASRAASIYAGAAPSATAAAATLRS